MPFEWNTPHGYLFTFLFEFILCHFAGLFLVVVLCFLLGSYFLLKSFTNDIANDLNFLNAKDTSTQSNKKDENKTSANWNGSGQNFEEIFCNAIQCHSELKQLSNKLKK